jgi:hypothetical protein
MGQFEPAGARNVRRVLFAHLPPPDRFDEGPSPRLAFGAL